MFENVPVDKIGIHNERKSNFEYLGADMIEGGNEFGAGTPYGNTARKMFRLIKIRYNIKLYLNMVQMS